MPEKLRDRGHIDWNEAARLRDEGLSYRAIGERLGCDPGSAYYAVNAIRLRRKRRRKYASLRPVRAPWTREEVVGAFQRFERENGRPPRVDDLGTHGLPWIKTVCRLFGRFNDAQRAAGFAPRGVGQPRKPEKWVDPWTEAQERRAA